MLTGNPRFIEGPMSTAQQYIGEAPHLSPNLMTSF